MAGKGGGAWKVAYADFVTAMMAFFLVMWIVAQSAEVKEAVAESFSQSSFGWSQPRGTRDPQMVRGGQRKAIATSRPSESVSDVRTKRKRFEDISNCIVFAESSSELDAKARQKLERLIPHLAGKMQRIEIRGHDVPRPVAQDGKCWDLCYARCLVTLKFLEQHGIASDRIRISLAGGNEPASDPSDPLPQSNSRVEVLLLSEFLRPRGEGPSE